MGILDDNVNEINNFSAQLMLLLGEIHRNYFDHTSQLFENAPNENRL